MSTVANPKGIFDRSTKGCSTPKVTVRVDRDRIRFFAKVLGETDPIHFHLKAARAEGHPDLVAPPSFFAVFQALANEELERGGLPSVNKIVGCDQRYLLHGDETYTYHGLVYAGDDLEMTTTIVDFFDKKAVRWNSSFTGSRRFIRSAVYSSNPDVACSIVSARPPP